MRYKKISTVSLAVLLSILGLQPQVSGNSSADYLKSQPLNDWSVMALAAEGSLSGVNLDPLRSNVSSATDIEKRILAIVAAGENPQIFSGENLVQKLANLYNGTEIAAENNQLNDDIFGLLAFVAANAYPDIQSQLVAFLKQNQNPDRGWSYAKTPASSDSNMTAMAIMALLASGENSNSTAIGRAFAFLSRTKTATGYAFDESQTFGPDAASTAWVISAYQAAGTSAPQEARSYLHSLAIGNGSYAWQMGSAGDALTTAYAAVAVNNKFYPVRPQGSVAARNVSVSILGPNGEIFSGELPYIGPAFSPLSALAQASQASGIAYTTKSTPFGIYVESIGGFLPSGLSGWLYAVNGVKPMASAADFRLQPGNRLLWFYASGQDAVPNSAAPTSPPDSSVSVNLTANITNPVPPAANSSTLTSQSTTPARYIVFGVNVNEANFGTLRPGDNSPAQSVRLSNNGNVHLEVTAKLQNSDALYHQGLYIENAKWNSYRESLPQSSSKQISLMLRVPADYQQTGQKNGTIIFWAHASE